MGRRQGRRRVRREPLTRGMEVNCAGFCRGRQSTGFRVFLLSFKVSVSSVTTPYRTLGTNAVLSAKAQTYTISGVPCLNDTGVALFAWGGGQASGLRAFHCRGGGALSTSRETGLDTGPARSTSRLFPRTGDHRVGREYE